MAPATAVAVAAAGPVEADAAAAAAAAGPVAGDTAGAAAAVAGETEAAVSSARQ